MESEKSTDQQHCSGICRFKTPLDAYKHGPREKLLYVTTVQPNQSVAKGDYLSTVDVDPESPTYCQVIHRTYTNSPGDELHHSGWNTCASCIKRDQKGHLLKRDKLVLPCLNSNNIYIVDTGKDPKKPELYKKIDGKQLLDKNVCAPHTTHCLPDGNIMISTMGDAEGNAKGEFILFDEEYNLLETFTKGKDIALCGYDFWYQPYYDSMIASEWGAPKLFRRGYQPSDAEDLKQYGRRLNFYKWSTRELLQSVDLGKEGTAPLEIRFLHDPKSPQGFVGACLYSNVYRFHKSPTGPDFCIEKIIDVPGKKVKNWVLDTMFGMMTDIIISLDDRFLYFSNWLHGDVRQYDISNCDCPKLTGQIFLGGAIVSDSGIEVIEDPELDHQPPPRIIKGRRLEGGPQMLQLSLDGKRLYVSSSLFSPWDKQFYPKMVSTGGTIVQIDVDTKNGGMKLNENFLVDFGKEPDGPTLPHEMRYPGGDCTSDIWTVPKDSCH